MTMTLEEMKMVSGGNLVDGLVKMAGATNGGRFNLGDRVLETRTMWHGTITEESWDYGHLMWLYTVAFDNGPTYTSIPERYLQAE